jgi:hypothetical protein
MKLIAKKNIKIGDICVILWKRYCRPAYAYDIKELFFARNSAKKGEVSDISRIPCNRVFLSK